MNLQQTIVRQGNVLFRYRSFIPLILFVLAVPFVYHASHFPLWYPWNVAGLGIAIMVSLSGFLFRAWAIGTTPKGTSGRNTKQQVAEQLNTSGVYSMVRHPLYLGNFLIWLGIVLYTFSLPFLILFALLFWFYYERIMIAEEDFIGAKFTNDFQEWAAQTPAFFPAWGKYKKGNVPFSLKTVLRREYSGFLATVVSFTYVDYLRCFFTENWQVQYRVSTFVLAGAVVITLTLRTLKHHTSLLKETDRS